MYYGIVRKSRLNYRLTLGAHKDVSQRSSRPSEACPEADNEDTKFSGSFVSIISVLLIGKRHTSAPIRFLVSLIYSGDSRCLRFPGRCYTCLCHLRQGVVRVWRSQQGQLAHVGQPAGSMRSAAIGMLPVRVLVAAFPQLTFVVRKIERHFWSCCLSSGVVYPVWPRYCHLLSRPGVLASHRRPSHPRLRWRRHGLLGINPLDRPCAHAQGSRV